MDKTPRVSVLMPVYNGERYLREAIESILNQTFTDFEFVIVDDGSTDGTAAILDSCDDPRIVRLKNHTNIGLPGSLNRGLTAARAEFVARMDADDISLTARLEKQVNYLDKHPEIGILGSANQVIDAYDQDRGMRHRPLYDLEIRWISLLRTPFAHPATMIRRDVMTQNDLRYDEAFQTAEDYELFTRMLKYTCGANLSEPLIRYRSHPARLTKTHRESLLKNHDTIALRTIQQQLPGFVITREQVSHLRALFFGIGRESTPGFDVQCAALANLYLDMFEIFAGHHSEVPDLKALQHQEALRVARYVRSAILQPRCGRLVGRLMRMDPGLPWSFLRHLSNAAGRRLSQRVLDILPSLSA